jgi:hypothetical protein
MDKKEIEEELNTNKYYLKYKDSESCIKKIIKCKNGYKLIYQGHVSSQIYYIHDIMELLKSNWQLIKDLNEKN